MRGRIFFKLMLASLLVILAATVTLDVSIRGAWESSLREEIEESLVQKTRLLVQRVETDRQGSLQEIARLHSQAAEARATIIDRSGKVLADSEADPATMENHAGRPEFMAALNGRVGKSVRFSHTLQVDFLYVAAPAAGGAVRLAYPLSAIRSATVQVRRTLVKGSLWALLVALLAAAAVTRSISRRLHRIVEFAERVATGDLSARIAEASSDEIAQVAAALDKTARKLEHSFAELRSSRQQLETLLESMQDAVIAVSDDLKVQWTNRAMNRLSPAGARVGAPVVEAIRDPDFLQALKETFRNRSARTARATSISPGRTFDVAIAPMGDAGAVAVLHDMSEIERVEKTRRSFIENVSHELRTPLSSIQGYSETLADMVPAEDATAREFLEIIRKNAARLSRIAEDLLILARVESGEERFEFQQVGPAELFEDALESFREAARSRGVELRVAEAVSAPVRADKDALHRVFANLIDNALKYGGSGGRIVLGAREVEGGVEFYVRDFGPGIPSEHLPRLFERFYRVDRARSRESGGTGLGLAIVKHILLAHGGSVRAESELNHGATFFFTLPREELAVAGSQASRASVRRPG